MSNLEVHASLKVRPGELAGFKTQVAELVRLTREMDTQTVRYDWFIAEDETACEVHEAYLGEEGLIEHNRHVMTARAFLFERYAYDHEMAVFGPISPAMGALFEKHAGGVRRLRFLQGLGEGPSL